MGTTSAYFSHFSYGKQQTLTFTQGRRPFEQAFDAVLGAEIARRLGYQLGDHITSVHGVGRINFSNCDDKPFVVTGILASTGTPVDQTVHVSFEAIEAIHLDLQSDIKTPGAGPSAEAILQWEPVANRRQVISAYKLLFRGAD